MPLLVLCRRFDIVLLLLDQHEPQWDTIVSEHVLANHQQVRLPWTTACVAGADGVQLWTLQGRGAQHYGYTPEFRIPAHNYWGLSGLCSSQGGNNAVHRSLSPPLCTCKMNTKQRTICKNSYLFLSTPGSTAMVQRAARLDSRGAACLRDLGQSHGAEPYHELSSRAGTSRLNGVRAESALACCISWVCCQASK